MILPQKSHLIESLNVDMTFSQSVQLILPGTFFRRNISVGTFMQEPNGLPELSGVTELALRLEIPE
jgi:hypothetical protein